MGRSRDERIDDAILAAGHDLVSETGYTQFSVEALCGRVGIAKTTLYKRWPARRALLSAILTRYLAGQTTDGLPDGASVRARLVAAVEEEISLATGAPGRAVALAVLEAIDAGGLPAEQLRTALSARRLRLLGVLSRAVETGELPVSTDPEVVVDLVFGAVWGGLVSGVPLTPGDAARLVDGALAHLPG
ncbi:MAG TPA: TetR/AcrR family transcriptional regulator [Acidimicrobiales bacterium]|nr:TetR/AcrR family transcriptional regulator [Acidimicrobiales bacterium]